MKLPTSNEKFVVTSDSVSYHHGRVVSGIHIVIRADEDIPDQFWYYVRFDAEYEGDVISCCGGCVYASRTLERALDFIAQYLTPYQEQEEKADEGSVVEGKTSDGRGLDKVSGIQKEMGALDRTDHDSGKYSDGFFDVGGAGDSASGIAGRLGGVSLA